ncbi:hypothetical protein AVEN_265194-1 [Araneus ventricosus]|uniref:DUF5641 domain-containing protein n=1 Tax=Araneus ventricosus TaxID=182803 RepID=A0A4Y2CR45_ARAVE|nr:hypothetical protein AVEN_265194-1 [Araneus ventricosus]
MLGALDQLGQSTPITSPWKIFPQLRGIIDYRCPDLDLVDSSKLNIRLKQCDTVRKELRSRFRKEYLSQLVQKVSVKVQSLKTGGVVLVGLDNRKPIDWPIGRVEKIYLSRDGFARVLRVKTLTGSLVRPIQKLYLLEVSEVGDPVLQIRRERRSRHGRLLQQPKSDM